MTLKIESIYRWTQKRLKLGMVSSFDPHNMCAKVESVTAKTGCTSFTKWTISSKVRGFNTKTHLLQRHFIFLNLFQLKTFLYSICSIQSHIIKFQPFLTSFAIFHAVNDLFWAKWPWNWKALQLNLEKVETWHGIIIWPTQHVYKSWEDYDKNWMHFVYKLDHLFQSTRVSDENSFVT